MKQMRKLIVCAVAFFVTMVATSEHLRGSTVVNGGSGGEGFSIDGIQSTIYGAFVKCMQEGSPSSLEEVSVALSEMPAQPVISYWMAYVAFYRGIYHLQYKESEQAKTSLEGGIKILKDVEGKDCEAYALLSRLQGIYMQFAGMRAMVLSKEMAETTAKAVQLCPENLRANLVAGSNDFYTPAQFGGGKKAEVFLLKAISLPDQELENAYLPSWGKDEAYELLIRFYASKGDMDKANEYYEKAIALFPDNYMIRQLKGE